MFIVTQSRIAYIEMSGKVLTVDGVKIYVHDSVDRFAENNGLFVASYESELRAREVFEDFLTSSNLPFYKMPIV